LRGRPLAEAGNTNGATDMSLYNKEKSLLAITYLAE
jgi:hypothetical protein